MEKHLKDFLHYYMGCRLKIIKGPFDHFSSPVLMGIIGQDIYFIQSDNSRQKQYSHGKATIDCVRPVLRKVEDMSKQEVLALCKHASAEVYGNYRYSDWEVTDDPANSNVWKAWIVKNDNSKEKYLIDRYDGEINIYNDEEDDNTTINRNYRFWFPKHGFDIFELIEAGLAIDVKTLNIKQLC